MSISRSIIVVDDEQELASLFKAFLKNEGYDVVSFTDPVLALEYYKETADKHSLIITDLRMPGICGIDLAKSIRVFDNKIKIFLPCVSGWESIDVAKLFMDLKLLYTIRSL